MPLWRGEHVETGQLAEDFAQYLYLPRLRDDSVLRETIQEGVKSTCPMTSPTPSSAA